MNVLSIVDLPDKVWESTRQRYPDLEIRSERDSEALERLISWPDIVFGNVPAEWAKRAHAQGRLKWLQIVSSGTDAYRLLAGLDLKVTSAKGVHHQPIAQHLIMMMLALTRNLPGNLRDQRERTWNRQPDRIVPVAGQQVGIIGYGGIARRLKPIADSLGMKTVGVGRGARTDRERTATEYWPMERLDELLETSQHVVLCLPFEDGLAAFMNDERFGTMTDGSYFYNIARGELVDEGALARALITGKLAGAALDVFQKEPLPLEHVFWGIPNLIVTPHIAGHYLGLREATQRFFCENLDRYLEGEPLKNLVVMN